MDILSLASKIADLERRIEDLEKMAHHQINPPIIIQNHTDNPIKPPYQFIC